MFIQTQATNDPDTIEFVPGREVYPEGPIAFDSPETARRSPLAARLFEQEQVRGVQLNGESVAVTKAPNADWLTLKPHVLAGIMQHFTSGQPVIEEPAGAEGAGNGAEGAAGDPGHAVQEGTEPVSDADDELIEQVTELIETRIQPAIEQTGGEVAFHSMVGGTLNLKLQGSAYAMLSQIENMLRHYVPEVEKVQDYQDAIVRPGLRTEAGQAVKQVLDERVNPAVAGHGGHITLIDVQGSRVYVRLEGGCQGCGMASVTLKQGIENEIKRHVPQVEEILDVTDHANGTNPYFQPGMGGGDSPVA
ncbi:NifU family protein [Rhodovibrio salinarum]|uniref:NifU family protein n=1 Tax=Rhodovibrio salinarum TaxID=1087 RepID=UPI0004AEDCBA|nr:NifU family protein [Rhodovibrio salinarum]